MHPLPAAALSALTFLAAATATAALATPSDAESAPARVVSTDAGVTEILLRLEAGERLVAVDASSEPPAGRSLPQLGYHRSLAAEGIIALAPDLLIGSDQMGPEHALAAVQRAGVEVLTLPYPGDVATLRANIQAVAAATGAVQAAPLLAELDRQSAQLKASALAGQRAALLLRGEGGKLRMAGAGTGGGGFVGLLGADNVADYRGYRSVTPEALLELAPDLLLLVDTEARGVDDLLADYPVLRFSPAVSAGTAYRVDADALVAGVSLAAVREADRVLALAHSATRTAGRATR